MGISISQNKQNSFGWRISWVLITTLSFLTVLESAPQCSYNPSHTTANCSNMNLQVVPWMLHRSINSFDLSGNNFPVVENQSFVNYPSIRQLSLRNNSIRTIKSGAFHSLNYLSILDLSNNKLTRIPVNSLKMVEHSIENLNLAGNKLHTIPSRVFANLVNLKQLDVSGNSIYRVEHGAFLGLSSLLVFKIRHNALTSLPSDSFDDFPEEMSQVQLYDNRWLCDCHTRWLWLWLNATDPTIWKSPGYNIRCDRPAFIRDEPLNSVSLEELACEVQMKRSGSTKELSKGSNTTLQCKYSSVPEVDAIWRKNSKAIDLQRGAQKYILNSYSMEDSFGLKTHVSELKINQFNYDDIAKYDCFVENIRGAAFTEYRLTLKGVDFDSVVRKKPAGRVANSGTNIRSIVIAVVVVSGIILLIVIVIFIFCSVNRVQRKRKQKRDIIQANINQHFMKSETSSNGDHVGPDGKMHKPKTLDGRLDDPIVDEHSKSNITMDSTYKPPSYNDDEAECMYPFDQTDSPALTNGNTYVSFGSELTEPSEFMAPPTPYTQAHPVRYEGSHAGSATPLLGRHTPSMYDSEEPVEDYSQYPVYDSVTNSLQHPNLPNNSFSNGDNAYEYAPNRQNSVSSYASYNHNGAPGERPNQYVPNYNGSMPRTPGSTRSGLSYGPRSVDGDTSPLTAEIYNNHYQPRPQSQHPNYNKYADHLDARYPATTPPPHRMTPNTKKSMSVGNLGYSPVATSTSGTGPRKPPRIYQSREYMELTAHDSSSDYITSQDAQNYSQSYGITPGTPV